MPGGTTHPAATACPGPSDRGSQPSAATEGSQLRDHHVQGKLQDPSDRAQQWREPGLVRIPLNRIGFWPGNRGGNGICSYHVHEVAQDCLVNKTKLNRYGHVDLVKIPSEHLETVREKNAQRAKSDSLLPKCNPADLWFVTASKTHFVHAQKLFQDGGRVLHNTIKTDKKQHSQD